MGKLVGEKEPAKSFGVGKAPKRCFSIIRSNNIPLCICKASCAFSLHLKTAKK